VSQLQLHLIVVSRASDKTGYFCDKGRRLKHHITDKKFS
jgi:hypothetical protein